MHVMKLFRKSDEMLQRPLWQKILIAVIAVVGDVLAASDSVSVNDVSENRVLVILAVLVGTWALLPLA